MRRLGLVLVTIICLIGIAVSSLSITTSTVADDDIPKCHGKTKGPDNDSLWNWDEGGTDIPCDEHIYTIVGTITTVESLSRQVAPATGSGSGMMIGGYGSYSSHYSGEIIEGKGYLVITVQSSDSEYAVPGSTIVIKTTDTKAAFVPEGYTAMFKCRFEYEAVAALVNEEKFDEQVRDMADTREFDYCRLATPALIPPS